VVLDLNLPGADGLSILRSVREKKASLPVMILTAQHPGGRPGSNASTPAPTTT
jgi:DNA-binding response OmpR family regulator